MVARSIALTVCLLALLTACDTQTNAPNDPVGIQTPPEGQQPSTTDTTKTQDSNTTPKTETKAPGLTIKTKIGPYVAYTNNGLSVIDRGDPDFTQYPITNNKVTGAALARAASLSVNHRVITDLQPAFVTFVANGKLWKTDLRVGSNLTMTQVSSATMSDVCFDRINGKTLVTGIALDSAPELASVTWTAAGPDGSCSATNDNQRFHTTLNADANTPALNITNLPQYAKNAVAFFDAQDLSIGTVEVLALNGKTIERYDAAYSNPAPIATAESSAEILFWKTNVANVPVGNFVRIDNSLRWYARGATALSPSRMTLTNSESIREGLCDQSDCFFIVYNRVTRNVAIHRISADGNSNSSLVASNLIPNGNVQLYNFSLDAITTNYVFYTAMMYNGTASDIYRVARNGGSPMAIGADPTKGESIGVINDARLMLTTYDISNGASFSVIDENNTTLFSLGDSIEIGRIFSPLAANSGTLISPNYIVLVSNSNAAMAGNEGANIRVYSTRTNTLSDTIDQLPLNTLGTIDGANETKIFFSAATITRSATSHTSQQDLYYIDLTQTGSLRRLTNTEASDEVVVQ